MAKRTRSERHSGQLCRCIAENTAQSLEHEYSRRFGRGEAVDLEEQIAPGVKLKALIREACFEELPADSQAESMAKELEDDNGNTDRT